MGEEMNVIVQRSPADMQGPDIVNVLLVTEASGRARGLAEINHNDTPRKNLAGNGPKNMLMYPCRLVEIIKKGSVKRGILTMYSRSYNKSGNNFTIDSAVTIETQL